MLTGLSGSLLPHDFAERLLHREFAGRLGEESSADARRTLRAWWSDRACQLGPASSLRAIWNVVAPLAGHLGFALSSAGAGTGDTRAALLTRHDVRVALLAGGWTTSLDSLWRRTVRAGLGLDTPWALCTNGRHLRLVDTQRTYSRACIQFDLRQAIENPATFQVFWGLLRAEAFRAPPRDAALIVQVIRAAARHGQAVNRSLRFGVIDAVRHLLAGLTRCGRRDLSLLFDESLTVVYRLLFLMFAEARGLVPNWHPLYRESYTIDSLRDRIEGTGDARGLWEALQAIARLAHRGCRAGSLVVPAFNGRLFSPARSPIAEACAMDDEIACQALRGLSSRIVRSTRVRIDYRDLGVEQLGAVYESVLDYVPARAEPGGGGVRLVRGGQRRKSTGSFYTPQAITDFVVRRTLHPLVAGAPADRILGLRVVDPAMGSAAFLVSACRYLAREYERALVRERACRETDLDDHDRAAFRRQIAQRCLFGVDLNPAAVQLARLSLWLATLSSNKPLTFLDHHLVCGDSLLGASPIDVARRPPAGGGRRAARPAGTPLFPDDELEASLARAIGERRWLAETGDDTAEVVREKERRLDSLASASRWKAVADLWCACWMWCGSTPAPGGGVFASLADHATKGRSALPPALAETLLARAADIARSRRFFHWVLEFPEAYFDDSGRPLANAGFDAVLGNPPWDVLQAADREQTFLRRSGVYRHQGGGRINRYQLFVERAHMLARRGGRIGLVLPAGFATDHTSAPLRRHLLTRASVDTITGFDNRKAIFPIHRSVRFLICTATAGTPTSRITCRFGLDDPATLDRIPDAGDHPDPTGRAIGLTPDLLAALAGDSFAIPELPAAADLRIVERIARRLPRLGEPDGWNARFGRELNATDDRAHFHQGAAGLPVLEGKHIEPFRVHVERAAARISARSAARLLDARRTFLRPRLAYRDVASSTNRLTLIAAVLPARVVTTHSLFCLKTPLPAASQAFLCGMLNSFVANYLVRRFMTTHLGSATVEALRAPRPDEASRLFVEVVAIVQRLAQRPSGSDEARLQALSARAYGLTAEDFAHVLGTFPLVPGSERDAAMTAFRRMVATRST